MTTTGHRQISSHCGSTMGLPKDEAVISEHWDCHDEEATSTRQQRERLYRFHRLIALEAWQNSRHSLFNDDWVSNPKYDEALNALSRVILSGAMTLCPPGSREYVRRNRLVLHAALYTDDCPLEIIVFFISCPWYSHLSEQCDQEGNMPLHLVLKHRRKHEMMVMICDLLRISPTTVKHADSDGLLPLERLALRRVGWNNGFGSIFLADPPALLRLQRNARKILQRPFSNASLLKILENLPCDAWHALLREDPDGIKQILCRD